MPKKMTKLYIVTGSRGEYSDRSEWSVCAFHDEAEGQKFAVRCQQEVRDAAAKYRAANLSYEDELVFCEKLNAKIPDPFISVDSYGASDASYYCGVLHVGRPPTQKEWAAECEAIQARRAVG